MPLKPPFDSIPAWLIDMDGVIYVGTDVLPGAVRFIQSLQENGHQYLFLTNNATKTPGQTVERLAKLGIDVPVSTVFNSAMATAAYLSEKFPPPKRVFVLGGYGIQVALAEAGYELVKRADDAELVVSALDPDATYADFAEAALAIAAGCPWIATNADPSLPTERGNLPGAGAMIAVLSTTTGRKPEIVGKPSVPIFEQALERLGVGPQDAIMVGDRLSTDILGGHLAGVKTLCVLTGSSTRTMAEAYDPRPDWIVPDLRAVLGSRMNP